MMSEDKGKYKDDMIYDIENAISIRSKRYLDKMDKLLERHDCVDDWVNLPEVQLKKYHAWSLMVGELATLAKEVRHIAIRNIVDEEESANEYNTQVCIDMGR